MSTTRIRRNIRTPLGAGLLGVLALTAFITLAWLLMAQAGPAEATDVSLVSNLAVTGSDTTTVSDGRKIANQFTTGSNTAGYTVNSVSIVFRGSTFDVDKLVATINSEKNGNPGRALATLTNPSSLSSGTNTFTVSNGLLLEPDTSYFITLAAVGGAFGQPNITAHDNQTGQEGWTIADNYMLFVAPN